MRTIHTTQITQAVRELCIEANHFLTPDMDDALKQAANGEKSPLGKPASGQFTDCRRRSDSYLSGHWHGSDFHGDRAGRPL